MTEEEMWPDVRRFISGKALEVIESNAFVANETACVPEENLKCLKENKILSCVVQKRLGGGGASLVECARILNLIGGLDAGLAVGLTMHFITVAHLGRVHEMGFHDLSEQLLKIVADQCIACSAGSEPGLGGAISKSSFATLRASDGYLISGRKTPVSLVRLGEYAHIGFANPSEDNGVPLEAVVPIRQSGLSVVQTWDTLGARSSESHTAVFDNYYVPDQLVLKVPKGHRAEILSAMTTWYCTLLTAAYLGLLVGVANETKAALVSSTLQSKKTSRGSLLSFQRAFGETYAKMASLGEFCVSVATRASKAETQFAQLVPSALSLRYVATDICTEGVSKLAELVGASAYANSHFISRATRDIHALAFHVPNRIMCQEMIGRIALGMKSEFDYQGSAGGDVNG